MTTSEYIERLVSEAPPFTAAQKSKLTLLLTKPEREPAPVQDDGFEALKEVAGDGQH